MYRMNTLIYCLDVLKIKEGTEVYRNAIELVPKVPINEWTSATEIIANASLSYFFSITVIRFSNTSYKRYRRKKDKFTDNNL